MSKTTNLNLDSGEGLASQVDEILGAFKALGIEVAEDPACEGSDHFGWNLINPSAGKTLDGLVGIGEIAAPATEEEIMQPVDFKTGCQGMRADIELVKHKVKNWHKHPQFECEREYEDQYEEMHANLQLAYRHLEDARMRLGKAIQAHDGGKSCYPA